MDIKDIHFIVYTEEFPQPKISWMTKALNSNLLNE